MVAAAHQWNLVGPWYRWNTVPEDPGSTRTSRPVIQKYADSNHVQAFMDNPQRSLKYLPEEDINPAGKRKIFLDTHDRFYLVACELHCDAPGFPKVNREQVCEAGFVVRKRKTDVPEEIRTEVESLLQEMALERSRLNRIESRRQSVQPKSSVLGLSAAVKQAVESTRQSAQSKCVHKLNKSKAALQALIAEYSIDHHVEGWQPQGNGLGVWSKQDEELPQQIDEQIFPLYPLIPDSTDEEHASGHKTIWYGLLPVGSSERDVFGNAQFDDKAVYEIRCFVRKHQDPCPKTNQRADCKGEIVWSRPTESYQLAPHFDLIGTSNRITMIQAPDLAELAEQVNSADFKMGQGLGLGVVSAADSAMPISVDGDGNPLPGSTGGLPSICFFAIPLITIVAMFLLRLTLPIVVFLFGLFFLLRLKLCILPQISIDLSAELDAGLEGELALEAELELGINLDLETNFPNLIDALDDIIPQTGGLQPWYETEIAAGGTRRQVAYQRLARMAIDQSVDFSDSGIAPDIIAEIKEAVAAIPDPNDRPKSSGSSTLPNPADRLIYYPTKQLSEVFV